jgi:hypothetical protein
MPPRTGGGFTKARIGFSCVADDGNFALPLITPRPQD